MNAQTYLAFGAVRTSEEGPALTDFSFTGQRLDSGTGLLFYGSRYYDSYLNRWLSPDTIVPDVHNPQSLNRYSYVLNRPVTLIDPTGHMESCPDNACGEGEWTPDTSTYGCDSSNGCTGGVPMATATCSDQSCTLDPADTNAVGFYASEFGIPSDLLDRTLAIEDRDDRQKGQDILDATVLAYAMEAKYGATPEELQSGAAGLGFLNGLEGGWHWLHGSENPGIGYNNIHVQAAWDVQDYYAKVYPGSNMTKLVGKDHDPADTVLTLSTGAGNMMYAAATLRMLADQRTGVAESHFGTLNVNDEAIIYTAYRGGIGPNRAYSDIVQFQARTEVTGVGQTFLKYYSLR